MLSLYWVDQTYIQKHQAENPAMLRAMYYPNLARYSKKSGPQDDKPPVTRAVGSFFKRYSRRMGMWLSIYVLSLTPVIGRFVVPAASFYTFRKSVGTVPAAVIFGSGMVLPKRDLVMFLQSYFASRNLMRELVSISSHHVEASHP